MVKPPADTRLPVYNWMLPVQHLARVREEIESAMFHLSREGAENVLMIDVQPLEHRYVAGERSQDLYEAMIRVKFR